MDHLGLKMTRCCHFEHLLPIFASWRMVMGESCGMANYPIIRYADADTYTRAQPSDVYLDGLLRSDQFIALAALQGDAVIGGQRTDIPQGSSRGTSRACQHLYNRLPFLSVPWALRRFIAYDSVRCSGRHR